MTTVEGRRRAPRPLSERVGIFQGRLVPSITGELQCSPGARWPEEFATAGAIGFSHVELFAERVREPSNPVWTPDGRVAIRAAAADAGIAVVSMCIEEPLDVALAGADAGMILAELLAPVVADLSLDVVVLPMADASDVVDLDRDAAAAALRPVAAALHDSGAALVLELTLSAADSLRFLDAVASPSVGICYDVGNATAAGFDPEPELHALGSAVWHVHAKDKDDAGVNVRFGTGRVDFASAFAALTVLGYDGAVTIEATRGDDPVATATEHRAFLLALERAGGGD